MVHSWIIILPHICNADELGTKTVVARVDIAPQSWQTPTPLADRGSAGFAEPAAPLEDRGPSLDHKPSVYMGLQQTGDENGYPPGRYHTVRCRNPTPSSFLLVGWVS